MKKLCTAICGALLAAGLPLTALAEAPQPSLEDYWRESWAERIAYHTQCIAALQKQLAATADEDEEFLTYEIEYSEWAIELYEEKLERLD